MKYSVIIYLLFSLASCQEVQRDNTVKIAELDTTSIVLDPSNVLDVVVNKSKNYTSFIIRDSTAVQSIMGCGNTFPIFQGSNISCDTIRFAKGKKDAYFFRTYVVGSTYGAEVNYLLYQSTGWELFRIPFDNNEVVFNKVTKAHEIIQMIRGQEIARYTFSEGLLKQL